MFLWSTWYFVTCLRSRKFLGFLVLPKGCIFYILGLGEREKGRQCYVTVVVVKVVTQHFVQCPRSEVRGFVFVHLYILVEGLSRFLSKFSLFALLFRKVLTRHKVSKGDGRDPGPFPSQSFRVPFVYHPLVVRLSTSCQNIIVYFHCRYDQFCPNEILYTYLCVCVCVCTELLTLCLRQTSPSVLVSFSILKRSRTDVTTVCRSNLRPSPGSESGGGRVPELVTYTL